MVIGLLKFENEAGFREAEACTTFVEVPIVFQVRTMLLPDLVMEVILNRPGSNIPTLST